MLCFGYGRRKMCRKIRQFSTVILELLWNLTSIIQLLTTRGPYFLFKNNYFIFKCLQFSKYHLQDY